MTDLKRIIRRLEQRHHYPFPASPQDEDDRPRFADAVVLQMPDTLRCPEETDHCKSETERGVEEGVKELLRDKPREEGAGEEQDRKHQPEAYFGFVIVPNPPKCDIFATGGVKLNILLFVIQLQSSYSAAKVHIFSDICKKKNENIEKKRKNARALAYVKKKQYLCSRF